MSVKEMKYRFAFALRYACVAHVICTGFIGPRMLLENVSPDAYLFSYVLYVGRLVFVTMHGSHVIRLSAMMLSTFIYVLCGARASFVSALGEA